MKKTFLCVIAILIIVINNNILFAQSDDVPYLSDDDIAAIEMILSDDIPDNLQGRVEEVAVEVKENTNREEISRLNTSQTIYHLLILDRTYCSLNSDIYDLDGIRVLYKFKHGSNGYLIAIYSSPREGPIFPQLPDKSRILVELMTVRINTIKEYINSSAFRRFVTSRRILVQMQEALK